MSDHLTQRILRAQRNIFRLAARDHGLSLKAISLDSGIHYDTLRAYARSEDPAMMPIGTFLRLVDVIPDYLLSQLLDPVGRHIAPNEESDGDLDELGREAASFTAEYVNAKSDGIVTPIEKAKLVERAGRLGAACNKATAA